MTEQVTNIILLSFLFFVHRDHKNRLLFQLRDKVCCTKNGYISDEEEEEDMKKELEEYRKGKEERDSFMEASMTGDGENKRKKKEKDKVRLCNGEIFFIREVRIGARLHMDIQAKDQGLDQFHFQFSRFRM